ncbi:ABC transporter ATP-binding protein [Pseudovibrio sp. WM33]|uniref:ABC transporter ATP-binding protein n=1 Tax=Pseudovibrio sp. WM33 TaxID=1735585 RepID=UPI0007AEAEB2|nr:ABC transporter ATP-binding protein [Pseudovibrio sp. WM33]KZL27661.1 putative osmoprotectant uptake system ATP-binding protein YehX [Pseudovibrio sp. WM33]
MIEIDNITKIYDGRPAVEAVSMTIESATITAIVGTSGSGKSTLLRMVNRLVEPTSGQVRINGEPTAGLPKNALRRRIGYAIQGHGLFPHHTVARNIGAVPRLLGWHKDKIHARVNELLDLFSMSPDEFRDRYPAELSGGQQQRVGVARALASRPDLLLMDEPFGALDPIIRTRAQADLHRIQRTLGSTILLVTHDMEEAIQLGDQVAVMDQGQLVQHGTPAEIITNPATEFVAEMVGGVDRPLRLLSLLSVSQILEDGAAEGEPIDEKTSLREALSVCLWSGRSALPVERNGSPIGRVTLEAIRSRAEGTHEPS